MDESKKPQGSWWQTFPGILTALTGLITAVAGLLVALHQVGLLGNKETSSILSSSSNNAATKPSESTTVASKTLAPAYAVPYSVTFPSGSEVTLRSDRADGTYKILTAQIDNKNTGKLSLKFAVRLTNTGRSDLGFWSDSFRLVIDGVPRAPINFLNTSVEPRSAKEGEVIFEMPDTVGSLVLSVANGEDTANIPISLNKPG